MKIIQKTRVVIAILFVMISIFSYRMYQGSDNYSQVLDLSVLATEGCEARYDQGLSLEVSGQCILDRILLKQGSYTINFSYQSEQDAVLNLYSAKYVHSDNTASKSFSYNNLAIGSQQVSIPVEIDKTTSDIGFYLFTEGNFVVNEINIYSNHEVFNDKLIIMVGYGLVILGLVALYFSKYFRKLWEEDKSFYVFLILSALFLIVSIPMLLNTLNNPIGQDLEYHLNRIQGLADTIRYESFPYRIHPTEFGYYGQAESVFYPELFIMLPAILSLFDMSLLNAYRIFVLVVNAATILVAYFSFKTIFKNRIYGVVGAILFTLSIYRLNSLYVRAAVGEYLAMGFLPLLALGVYELFYGKYTRWWITTLAMTCIMQSHLITTELSAFVCLVLGLVMLPKLWNDKKRLYAVIKAVLLFVLLNLWWLVPFIDFSMFGVGAFSRGLGIQEPIIYNALDIFAITYPLGAQENMPFSIGFILALCLVLYFILQTKQSFRARIYNRMGLVMALLSVVLLFVATQYFPWNEYAILKEIGGTLQFSWRTFSVTTILLVLCTLMILKYFKQHKYFVAMVVLLSVGSGLLALPILSGYFTEIPVLATKSTYADIDSDKYTLGGWYFPLDTDIFYLYYEPGTIKAENEMIVSNLVRRGTELSFDYQSKGDNTVVLPILFYPGYQVYVNDVKVDTYKNDDNLIAFNTNGTEAYIKVDYEEQLLYMIANGISLMGLVLLIMIIWRGKTYEVD